jgi:uncharacterized OsmC-like protein
MGFELKDLQIEISGNLNPARLFGKTEVERAGYNSIEVKMIPVCDADEVTLNEWLRKVESRCPVSDNIMNSTPLKVGLKLLQVA